MKVKRGKVRYSELEKLIMTSLGHRLYEHMFKGPAATVRDIEYIGISAIEFKRHLFSRNELFIYCRRPGFIFGKKCERLAFLTENISNDMKCFGYNLGELDIHPVENDIDSLYRFTAMMG